MIYTNKEMTNEYGDFVITRFDCDDYDDAHDVEVEVKFTGPPTDLVLYIRPNCIHEKVFVRLIIDFCFGGWPVGRSEINIMGGNVKLFIDFKYIGINSEKLHEKTNGIVEINTMNDANVTILNVPPKTKLYVCDHSSVRVVDSNIDRAVVMYSGNLVTKVPLNIIAHHQSKVIDLTHGGISEVDASDKAKIITHNNDIKASIQDDASVTFRKLGSPTQTWTRQPMNMHEFACYIAKKEGGKSQANIGDIKEILRIINTALGSKKLSRLVKEGVYVYE